MDPWRLEVRRAISLSLAPGTRKGYHRAVCLFEHFRKEAGYRVAWPILIDYVLHYGVSLKTKGLAVSTIKGRLSVLAFASKTLGYAECMFDFQVRRMLDGWRR